MIREIKNLISEALMQLPDGPEDPANLPPPEVERTRDPRHGDYATNVAMKLAGTLGCKPRELAESIAGAIDAPELIDAIEVAGPGFINFRLSADAWRQRLREILEAGENFGTSDLGQGQSVILEYVSANPTGPLHVGHGRHAAYGDTLSRLLTATGYAVHQEYYVNDAGRQMDILALSVWLRMLEQSDQEIVFPAGGYRGDYVRRIAADGIARFGAPAPAGRKFFDGLPPDAPDGDRDEYLDALIKRARDVMGEESFRTIHDLALEDILADIQNDLEEFGATVDQWYSERSLTDTGRVSKALELLAANQVTYEKDGAVWFRATDYGDEKDRVVVRENGRTTYFASDIAYHLDKRERKFAVLLDVLGADHHGYVARVRAGLAAMDQPGDSLEVRLVQFVALYRGGEKMQMSTRAGDFVTLRDLRREVGNDAARFFFVMRSNDQHLDFDLELAKSQSNDNPVYYVQYAHARVCSLMRELKSRNLDYDAGEATASLDELVSEHEQSVIRSLSRFPEIVELAARQRAPQHLVHYLRELAHEFHTCYNAHRFIVDDSPLRNARLMLALGTQQVLVNGLNLLGVRAPESM